jgi:hypothetical protein
MSEQERTSGEEIRTPEHEHIRKIDGGLRLLLRMRNTGIVKAGERDRKRLAERRCSIEKLRTEAPTKLDRSPAQR